MIPSSRFSKIAALTIIGISFMIFVLVGLGVFGDHYPH